MIHYHFDTVSSTNDIGKKILSLIDENTLAVISAEEQTRGRGQHGKRWLSPKSLNLIASFCFLWKEPLAPPLTQLMALSAASTLKQMANLACTIKLPNDLLVDGKKISGILCETSPLNGKTGIVIGISINLNAPLSFLKTVGQPSTSVLEETGRLLNVFDVLCELKKQFKLHLLQYAESGFLPFQALILNCMCQKDA